MCHTLLYVVSTLVYLVLTTSQGGRYFYFHLADEQTEAQVLTPQLLRADRGSNPPRWLHIHTLTHHIVLGAGHRPQGVPILVLLKQQVKGMHQPISRRMERRS